jgi:hypothetical protein
MALADPQQPQAVELGAVFLNERRQRFEFLARGSDGTQPYGHYRREDAERHREQYADRLRARGYVVVLSDEASPWQSRSSRRPDRRSRLRAATRATVLA